MHRDRNGMRFMIWSLQSQTIIMWWGLRVGRMLVLVYGGVLKTVEWNISIDLQKCWGHAERSDREEQPKSLGTNRLVDVKVELEFRPWVRHQ